MLHRKILKLRDPLFLGKIAARQFKRSQDDQQSSQHGAIRQYFSAERPMPVARPKLSANLPRVLAVLAPTLQKLPRLLPI